MSDTLEIFGQEYTNVAGIKATDDNGQIKTYTRPQGTKSISANGTGIDVTEFATVDVSVPTPAPTIESLSVTPSETQQTYNSSSVDGYKPVTVGAISSTYVGSGITRRSSSDMTSSGATVTAPAGYYANASSKAVASGAVVDTWGDSEFTTVNNQRKFHIYGGPSISAGWMDSGNYSGSDATFNAVPANTTVTPSTSAQTIGGAKYMMEGAVTVAAMPSGTAGTPTATKGTVSNHAVTVTPSVTNSTGYISGGTKTGTAVSVSASELVSGTLEITSSGTKDVTNYASASVASGSATASATKGTVSNHSVTVTPSVTRTAGYVTAGTATGTGVSVSASELVSGNLAITENGTNIDVTNYATVSVAVEGGGGGMTVATANTTLASANASISFTGLSGEPTSFVITTASDLATGASPYKTATVVFDGSDLHGQIVTNTSNANASYSTSFTKSYSNGTLTVTGSGTNFQANQYKLIYTYGGNSANIGTAETQVGSGATSITFTGLTDEPDYFSVIFKSNFGTSSGYQRVQSVAYDGTNTYGVAMDSGANAMSAWSYTYSNGSLTVSSQGTNNGGYFHQPGYYQLTYGIGGTVEPTEIEVEPLSVTQNGTYTAPTGKAYSPVTVNVSGGGANIATATMTNSSNQNTSISFTLPSGRTPIAFFCRCTSSLSRSSSNTYYYVADIRWDGSSSGGYAGHCHARSNGQLTNVTSGYSHSQSGTTFTVTSSGSRGASPGSFYNGGYELVYIY